jgi:mono/diheme cytochrome c family protein
MGRKVKRQSPMWSVLVCAFAGPALLMWAGSSGAARPGVKPLPAQATSKAASERQTLAQLEKQYVRVVQPFMRSYCTSCHGKDAPQAQLDLSRYTNAASVLRDLPHWALVLEKLGDNQMPPAGSKQPPAKQREAVLAWIRAARQYEASRNAGDPGPVLARRLSNAEYDYTIRDLTGMDLRPTREFPVDPANQEGFDNSGETLTLSPALMKKYVQAAKTIADHLVLTSTGLEFAAHPVLADTDRDKYCILRIVDFYRRQPTDYADYFEAAWRYRHRAALGVPDATLESVAAGSAVSPRYLALVWNALTAPGEKVGPIAKLQAQFNALPAPDITRPAIARPGCEAMRDWVAALRKKVAWKFDNLRVPRGFSPGGQCFVLWKDRAYATHRRKFYTDNLQFGGVPKTRVIRGRRNENGERPERNVTDPVDPDLFVPEEEAARAPYIASFTRFCDVFPDAFYIAERGRMFVDDPGDRGRLLSAGLHNSMGYFRDDTPLMELILDENGRRELNRLWDDFDQVAYVPERMHLEFIFYERAESGTIRGDEFNFARSEDKDAVSDAKIRRLGDVYLAKARRNLEESGGQTEALKAIEDHFQWVSKNIRATERARIAAEPRHRRALLDFARRAYRRPLTPAEHNGLMGFYRSLREKDGLTHEDAIRDTLISILMSPNFLFRLDLEATENALAPTAGMRLASLKQRPAATRATPPGGGGVEPLSDYALASRLSYFLWSSMPDEELLREAAAGNLRRPDVLVAQARRMMKDPRVRALAVEFGGNWLDFRRFEEHNAVDRERFPAFTNELRQAMFEEPTRYFMDTFQNNRSVLDLLYGKHTFVNATLAKHYGMTDVKAGEGEWVRVPDADRYGRGGLLPMAVFLTTNSPGLRTSPVKRGYWVVRRLLGEHIPPPPPTVPELPKDESQLGELTLRQALEKHRNNPACSGCHARFDSYGLVFEGYGPIGEQRKTDLGGKPVDTRAPFPGGIERSGVEGLREFVRAKRQKDFLDTFDRKMLSYALGRSLLPSDDATLLEMRKQSIATGHRFGTLVETIVTSRQFRNRRALTTATRD